MSTDQQQQLPPCLCDLDPHHVSCPLGMFLRACAQAADEKIERARLAAEVKALGEQVEAKERKQQLLTRGEVKRMVRGLMPMDHVRVEATIEAWHARRKAVEAERDELRAMLVTTGEALAAHAGPGTAAAGGAVDAIEWATGARIEHGIPVCGIAGCDDPHHPGEHNTIIEERFCECGHPVSWHDDMGCPGCAQGCTLTEGRLSPILVPDVTVACDVHSRPLPLCDNCQAASRRED